MNILVTGGAGFIGRWLCKRLLEEGHYVCCLDNLQSSSIENILEFMNHSRFTFCEADVTKLKDVPQHFTFYRHIDQIYHLACPASPVQYQKDPINTLDICYIGTKNILNIARSNSIIGGAYDHLTPEQQKCTIVFTSTSEVYGDPEIDPQSESYNGNVNIRSIRACYDEGKRVAETLCTEYVRKYDMDVRIARLFNTYGPYLAKGDGRVVSNFIVQCLNGDDVTVYGDGTQTRSLCYVSDTVNGLVMLMNSTSDLRNISINIGNPEERTILSFAHDVIEITESNSNITYHDLPEADPKQRRPNIDLALEKIGWEPKVNYKEGLKLTIDYFKNRD